MNALVKELYEHAQRVPLDQEWEAECERRWAQFERGDVAAVDAETAHDRLKAQYGWS